MTHPKWRSVSEETGALTSEYMTDNTMQNVSENSADVVYQISCLKQKYRSERKTGDIVSHQLAVV